MRSVAIVGCGVTKFGRSDKTVVDLLTEASLAAIDDAGLDGTRFDDVFVGNMASGEFEGISGLANLLVSELGLEPASAMKVEYTSASGGAAFYAGWMAVASGQSDLALVAGGEKMTSVSTGEATEIIASLVHPWERAQGVTLPSLAGLVARAYLAEFGATRAARAVEEGACPCRKVGRRWWHRGRNRHSNPAGAGERRPLAIRSARRRKGLSHGSHRPRRYRCRRTPRHGDNHGGGSVGGVGVLPAGKRLGRRGARIHHARRPIADQHERRTQSQRSPAGRDGRGADRRDCAANPGAVWPEAGGGRDRTCMQRSWFRQRLDRHDPEEVGSWIAYPRTDAQAVESFRCLGEPGAANAGEGTSKRSSYAEGGSLPSPESPRQGQATRRR